MYGPSRRGGVGGKELGFLANAEEKERPNKSHLAERKKTR